MEEEKRNELDEQASKIEKEEAIEPLDSKVEKQQAQQNEEIKVKNPFPTKIVAIAVSAIAVVTIGIVVLFGLLGGNGDNNEDKHDDSTSHTHVYGAWTTTVDPTCETSGTRERICSCGEKESENITAKGHTFGDWIVVKESTCAEEGTETQVCACGEKVTRSIAKINEHNVITDDAVESTCSESGLTEGSHCSVCGAVFVVQSETPKKTHTYDDRYDENCNVCGYIRDADCSHSNTVVIPGKTATCTEAGLTDGQQCSKCSEILIVQTVIVAKGHTDGEWTIDKNPTCIESGSKHQICSDCNATIKTEVISAKGHTEVLDSAVSATCSSEGKTEGKHCSTCGYIIIAQSAIPKASHTYDDRYDASCNVCGSVREADCAHVNTTVIPGKTATCTDAGLTEGKKCSKCGEILIAQTTIGAKGHTNGAWITDSSATCTENGSKHQVCSVCNVTLKTETIAATGHTNGAWITDIPATCTESGSKHQVCSVCNKTVNTQTISATGHNIITDAAVSPTCTTAGKTEGSHCSICNYISVAQTAINANGHHYNNGIVTTEASCVQNGVKKFTCTTIGCGYSYTESFSLQSYSATELYSQASKYVGEIVVYDKKGIETSLATGFVYTSDGQIITNYHVIDEAYSAVITLNGRTYAIKQILAYDENIDLAILKIDATGLIAANVCKQPVKTGETVYAIGSSRGLTNTYSQGIITYADRVVDGVSHIQHDASITHGNSGGPLINVYGEVIGINTWGISDSQNLNFAVFTDEIDNLVYGQAMSLADFYNINHSPYNTLVNWVLKNYNAYSDTQKRLDYKTDSKWYSIVYETEDEYLYIDVLATFSNGDELYLYVDLSSESQSYYYYARYSDADGNENRTKGYIYAPLYTVDTLLTYTSCSGSYFNQASITEYYQTRMIDLIAWFEWATVYYDTGVTIKDFGFDVFEKNSDTQSAKDLLIESVLKNGEYNAEYNWYNVREKYDYSNKTVYYNIYYHIETGNLTLQKAIFYDSGEYWNTHLSLEPTSLGMYYSCTFEEKHESGAGYEIINDTYGYIDPKTFTKDTVLTYKEYNGAENKKSTFLGYYAEDISDLLNWVYYYFDKESLDITFSDLGF